MQGRKSEEMVFVQEMKTNASAKIRRNGLHTEMKTKARSKFRRNSLHTGDEDQCKVKNQKKWSSLLLQKEPTSTKVTTSSKTYYKQVVFHPNLLLFQTDLLNGCLFQSGVEWRRWNLHYQIERKKHLFY